jgi:hypothetical protein
MNRLEIRKAIQKVGKEFYESIKNKTLQNIAGEFMALNEYYVFVHQGEDETYGTLTILREGFLTNQKKWIRKLGEGD